MMQEPFSCDGLATAICSADGRQVITWWSPTRADASNSLPINILVKILYLIEY